MSASETTTTTTPYSELYTLISETMYKQKITSILLGADGMINVKRETRDVINDGRRKGTLGCPYTVLHRVPYKGINISNEFIEIVGLGVKLLVDTEKYLSLYPWVMIAELVEECFRAGIEGVSDLELQREKKARAESIRKHGVDIFSDEFAQDF